MMLSRQNTIMMRLWRRAATLKTTRLTTTKNSSRTFLPHDERLFSTLSALSTFQDSDKHNTNNNNNTNSNIWTVKEPKKGSGFDQFFPPGENKKKEKTEEGDKEKSSSSSSSSTEKQQQDDDVDKSKSSKFESSGGGGGDNKNNDKNKNNKKNPFTSSSAAQIAFLGILYVILQQRNKDRRQNNEEEHQGGIIQQHDITWHDLHELLETRQIEKLVVYNPSSEDCMVRVILKPGMPGLQGRGGGRRAARFPTMRRLPTADEHAASDSSHHDAAITTHHTANDDEPDLVQGLGTTSTTSTSSKLRPPVIYRLNIGSVETFEHNIDEIQRSLHRPLRDYVPVQYKPDSTVASELLSLVPNLVMVGIFAAVMMGMRGSAGGSGGGGGGGMGGIFQIGKSTAKKINKEEVNVTFADVAGCQEAKKEIMEFVDFLQDSSRFTELGAKIPKGALLCGPPGTGKTLLARAVAGEANVPFYSISGSDFIEMFVGVGPSRVRDLFKEARQNAPCIIFIDEIDAVGRQRGRGGIGGNDERENTLNQLLVEMDGFTASTNVVVLAGTNRVDILDQALTRPGRFDRQIVVDKPDLQGRKEIFLVHLKGIELEEEAEDIAGRLAGLTPGFAGADIANICNEAAIVAARRKGESVSMEDFEKATDRIIGGLESNKIISKEERDIVAHHEAGHAVAGWFLEHADPLLKVTIIPRTSGALGFAQYLPKEVFLRTQDQIMDIVCMALAGRAAEEIFFGRVTTGASDDLRRVTDIVYSTIQLYGMNERLGQLAFPKDPNAMFEDRPYSDATAKAMDEEAKRIVDAAYQRTLDLLTEKKEAVEQVAAKLIEKETITHDDIVEILGDRPFKRDTAYDEFVRRRQTIMHDKDKNKDGDKDKEDGQDSSTTADDTGPLNPGVA